MRSILRTSRRAPALLGLGIAGAWGTRPLYPAGKASGESNGNEADADMPLPKGPMVAVYLDDKSVETLQALYPNTRVSRLRKVVLQYNPTDEERHVYEPLFDGNATVKVLGEASSVSSRALVASVSFGGGKVKSRSLTPAIDLAETPESGGPLASAVLAEQVKQAGATIKKRPWQGQLPALSAHHRYFPGVQGGYTPLEKPLKLTGSICRADWVDGASTKCRLPKELGGEPGANEEEGQGLEERRKWEPSGCHLCNTLRGSPCHDIFRRWEALSELVRASGKFGGPEEDGDVESEGEDRQGGEERGRGGGKEGEEQAMGNGNEADPGHGGESALEGTTPTKETGRRGSDGVELPYAKEERGVVVAGDKEEEIGEGDRTKGRSVEEGVEEGEGERATGGSVEVEESEEYQKLMDEMVVATVALRECIDYHDVFAEAEADLGS